MRNDGFPLKAIAWAILILNLSLTPPSLWAEQKGSLKAYPLPIVEAEGVLSGWLMQSGFDVSRSSSETGTVRLTGRRGEEIWEVILSPRSPLASSVQAEYTLKGQPDPARLEALWTFLEEYLKGTDGEEKNSTRGVPARVLSKRDAVVCIKAREKTEPIQFSGFIVDGRGFILATAHDLKRVEEIRVTLSSGQELKGDLVKIDSNRDLTLIDVHSLFPSFISLERRRDLLGRGENVYMIGCPDGQLGVIHTGRIRGPLQQKDGLPLWQVEMDILPGSSGSPVFDAEGNFVGVVKGRYRGTETVGFLIPIETVIEFLKER
jgi:serine protease Do